MDTNTLPTLPVIPAAEYSDLLNRLQEQYAHGIYDGSVCSLTDERTRELTAKAMPTDKLQSIEAKQAELARKQSELEAQRQEHVRAVETYAGLLKNLEKASDRLRRADQQMASELLNADDQREHIYANLGVKDTHFDFPGRFQQLFAQISVIELVQREWPPLRARLVAEVEAAHKAALDHVKKWGLREAQPEKAPTAKAVTAEDCAPTRYEWPTEPKVGFRN